MKRLANTGNKLLPVLFFILLLAIWEAIVDIRKVPEYLIPSPIKVFVTLWEILPDIWEHAAVTLQEAIIGFLAAVVLSLLLAFIMDAIQTMKKAIYPLLVVSQTIPIIALAPLFILWFGFGIKAKIFIVILVCFFPIIVNLMDGLNSVDRDMLMLFRSMGAGKLKSFLLLKLPASMVSFFSGLRIAATYSIMGAVIGEWLGGEKGLGLYMVIARRSFATDRVLAVTIVIVVLSMALFKLITLLQDIFIPWYKLSTKTNGGSIND